MRNQPLQRRGYQVKSTVIVTSLVKLPFRYHTPVNVCVPGPQSLREVGQVADIEHRQSAHDRVVDIFCDDCRTPSTNRTNDVSAFVQISTSGKVHANPDST